MSNEATPGLWKARKENESWIIENVSGSAVIAYGAGWYGEQQPGEANARLLAAAPALRDAALLAVEVLRAHVQYDGGEESAEGNVLAALKQALENAACP